MGLGIAYLPAIVAVSVYFEKRRSLAMGIAVCGSGIGTFLFAPLTSVLLSEYSWKGTVMIETGILLNCILCATIFRPLNVSTKPAAAVAEDNPMKVIGTEQPKTGVRSAPSPELTRTSAPASRDFAHSQQFSHPQKSAVSPTSSAQLRCPMARKDEFCSKNLEEIRQYQADRVECDCSLMTVKEQPNRQPEKNCLEKIGITKDRRRTITETMDFRLLLDVVFILFAVSTFLADSGSIVAYIFLANRGLRLGFSNSETAWLISMVGISNTVGRVVFGYISDMKCVNRLVLCRTVRLMCGICSVLSVLLWTFPLQMCYSFSFGLFSGTYSTF